MQGKTMPLREFERGGSRRRQRRLDVSEPLAPLSSSSPSSLTLSLPPASASPLSKSAPLNRQGRQEWLKEQLGAREKLRDRQAQEAIDAQRIERDRLWNPLIRRAEISQELNLAWQERQRPLLDPTPQGQLEFPWQRVFVLPDLLTLRLTGLTLKNLPESLPDALPQLTTLSIVACELENLPARLGQLTFLTELDLTGNQLRSLPDSLPGLQRLERLTLSNNKLESLPDHIGGDGNIYHGLQRLERLQVEQNELRELPDSIGMLSRLFYANFSGNQLETLPLSIGDLPCLDSLIVSLNSLHELPESLALLPKLRILHASRNALQCLPHNFGDFKMLEDACIDWNSLRELPFSLRKLRDKLHVLSLEQNPLVLPPREVVVRGVKATMAYMDKALDEFQRRARRNVLETLQQTLHLASPLTIPDATRVQRQQQLELSEKDKDDLATIQALFEPHIKHSSGGEQLMFFAIVWEEFFSTLLPAIERQLQRLAAELDNHDRPEDSGQETKAEVVELAKAARFSQRFSQEEIEDALTNSADDFGSASTEAVSSLFRKCACLEPLEPLEALPPTTGSHPHTPFGLQERRRRVCPPPGVTPYRCRRVARLIREQLLTHDEAKDQLATTYLRVKLARLEAVTKRQCIEYINSEAGVVHFEQLAAHLASTLFGKRKRLRGLEAKHKKAVARLAAKRSKLLAKLDAYSKARIARKTALEAKLAKLNSKAAGGNKASEKRAKKVEEELAEVNALGGDGPDGDDDPRVLELELALEGLTGAELKLNASLTAAKDAELRSFLDETIEAASLAESGDDSDADEVEDVGDSERKSDDEDDSDDDMSEEESDNEEEEAKQHAGDTDASAEPSHFFQFDVPDESKMIDYRLAAMQLVEHELTQRQEELDKLHEEKNKAKKGKHKPAPTIVVHVEELIELFQPKVRDTYVAERCARVTYRATVEYLQMRAVLKRWLGHGKRAVFEGWRDYMRENRADAAKRRAKREMKKLLEEQNRMLAEQLTRLEARKWVQRVDMYTDAVYYENTETGETSWTPPQCWEEEQAAIHSIATVSAAVNANTFAAESPLLVRLPRI